MLEAGARQREDYIGTTSVGIGSCPLAAQYAIVEEQGSNFIHRTILQLTNAPVTVANVTGASFGSIKVYDFPETRFQLVGGNWDLKFDWSAESIVQDGSGDASLGTTATADATLGGTDVDLAASAALTDPFVAGIGYVAGSLVKDTEFDGSGTAKDMNLNIIIDDADVSNADTDTVLVTGTIEFVWISYGDRRTF